MWLLFLVFSLFPVDGLQCSILFSGTGIPCLLFDPFVPLVFLPGQEDAFSSERKYQFPLSWRVAQVFYFASNTVLYFLNKGAFLRSTHPARNNSLFNFSAKQSGLLFLSGHRRMKKCIFFFWILFTCLFSAVLDLHCCSGFSLVASRRFSLVALCGFLASVACCRCPGSEVHLLQELWLLGSRAQLNSCGARA